LPILNEFLRRMRLEDFLRAALPPEDRRMKLSPVKALLVLLRNLLVSREPIYGVGEWAARHAADALGLLQQDIERLNDDGVGRALDRLFLADVPSLVLAVPARAAASPRAALPDRQWELCPRLPGPTIAGPRRFGANPAVDSRRRGNGAVSRHGPHRPR